MRAPPGLYAIVDPSQSRGRDPERVAEAILRGGCSILQLRMKSGADSARLSLARAIAALARSHGVPFVMNDRPDLAVLAQADGLHLGQDDLPIALARQITGSSISIGRSTHDEAQAQRAAQEGADVIAFGPIFETSSKENPDPVVGLPRLRAVCDGPVPIVAIGGITHERALAIAAAGARWGAAIGAVCAAEDPEVAARALHLALGGNS